MDLSDHFHTIGEDGQEGKGKQAPIKLEHECSQQLYSSWLKNQEPAKCLSIPKWVKEIFSGFIFNDNKEYTTNTRNMNESEKNVVLTEGSPAEEYMAYYSVYMTF